ncbi:5825_t:CDS:1, partial [Dentiscutata erythropus]
NVIICARRDEMLSNVAEECRKINDSVKVLKVKCDIANESEVSQMFEIIKTTFDRLDCIILNAGVSMGEQFEDTDYSIIKKIMDINYFGSTNVTHKALPLLKNNKKSRILVVNSIIGIIPIPLRTGYAASKFALRGFFESLQSELWKDEIFITMAYP